MSRHESHPPPSNDDILWLGSSSPLLLSQTVMVTTNGADFSAPCLFGETVAHHSLGHTGFLLRNQLPLELPFLVPQFRAGSPSCQVRCSSEGFGSSIFFGAKPIRYTVKPSQTSYQKKGGSFKQRILRTFDPAGALQSKVKGG